MNNKSWMNESSLKGIDPQKLLLLMQLQNNAKDKSMQEILPFLMASVSQMKKKGISFSSNEFQLIFEALKQGKSQEEIDKMNQMNQMIQMFQMMNH